MLIIFAESDPRHELVVFDEMDMFPGIVLRSSDTWRHAVSRVGTGIENTNETARRCDFKLWPPYTLILHIIHSFIQSIVLEFPSTISMYCKHWKDCQDARLNFSRSISQDQLMSWCEQENEFSRLWKASGIPPHKSCIIDQNLLGLWFKSPHHAYPRVPRKH